MDQLAAIKQNANRYEWLRYRMTSVEAAPMRELTGVKLDRAIDAALAQGAEPNAARTTGG